MINDDLAVKIIGLYSKNYFNLLSINQIAKKLNKKYPYVHKITHELISKGYLKNITLGRSILCSLDLNNPITLYILGYHHIIMTEKIIKSNPEIGSFKDYISKEKKVDFMLIDFKGRSKNNNIICVSEYNLKISKEINTTFEIKKGKELIELFVKNKKIFENHIVCFGFESFINLIKENQEILNLNFNPLMQQLINNK
jgi:DNA-binding Lrp family transcriptional regulator